jgi:DNA-binding LytR/AlgR family response regulator
MLKCIIVDDEQLALDLLEDYIHHIPYLELTARCKNALEASRVIQKQPVDLVFLDIMMPGMTGLQFVQSMVHKPMVVMITAYAKYAVEGFNLDVIDYLVKPVALDRFIKACSKAWEYHQFLLSQKNRQEETIHPGYFFVNADYSLVKIMLDDVVWIEGLKDYIKIHLQSLEKPVITLMSMKAIGEHLPDKGFIRIHKSYIVSVRHITAIRKNSVFIGTLEIPVGGNYKPVIETLVRGAGNAHDPY